MEWSREWTLPECFTHEHQPRADIGIWFVAEESVLLLASSWESGSLDEVPSPADITQLHIERLDPLTGETLWTRRTSPDPIPNVRRDEFMGWLQREESLSRIDFATGACIDMIPVPGGNAAFPVRRGENTALAWHARGTLHAAIANRITGQILRKWSLALRRPKSLDFCPTPDGFILLNINAQTYALLDPACDSPRVFKLPGWFRNAGSDSKGNLIVQTSSATGLLDCRTGSVSSTISSAN